MATNGSPGSAKSDGSHSLANANAGADADAGADGNEGSGDLRGDAISISDAIYVPPVPTTSRILCLGLNYLKHAEEQGDELPSTPTVFARYRSTLTGHLTEVPIPSDDDRFDWEGELAVIIGRPLKDAAPEEAEAAILGYTCFNDLSSRGYQWATSQWTLGKNADKSGPIGPVVVTPDELGDPYKLKIETRVNGATMQSGSTSDMMFRAPETISYISRTMTLLPGDVLSTGTPDGVGFARTPPIYLKGGDTVEVEIEGIGILSNRIVASAPHK
jgi:2-keto-4-pentenoate hydratase/2-oxohepta-3-ene-1,7-dioic acid hydratase in catechol pathway